METVEQIDAPSKSKKEKDQDNKNSLNEKILRMKLMIEEYLRQSGVFIKSDNVKIVIKHLFDQSFRVNIFKKTKTDSLVSSWCITVSKFLDLEEVGDGWVVRDKTIPDKGL